QQEDADERPASAPRGDAVREALTEVALPLEGGARIPQRLLPVLHLVEEPLLEIAELADLPLEVEGRRAPAPAATGVARPRPDPGGDGEHARRAEDRGDRVQRRVPGARGREGAERPARDDTPDPAQDQGARRTVAPPAHQTAAER